MHHKQAFQTRFRRAAIFAVAALLVTSMTPAGEAAERVYTLARAPQLSTATMAKIWQPYVDYLSREVGVKIKLVLYNLRENFETDLQAGTPDLAYGNPGYFVVSHLLHGYVPLIRSGAKPLVGILVAKSDGGVRTLDALRGQEIAFPNRNAWAASLLMRAQLTESKGIAFKPVYVGSHDDVNRNVAAGRFVAGGGVLRTFNREPEALRKRLLVIYKLPGVAPHPLFAHPRVPESVRQAVIAATLKLVDSDEGHALLKNLAIRKPIIADYDRDYRTIEPIASKMYEHFFRRGG